MRQKPETLFALLACAVLAAPASAGTYTISGTWEWALPLYKIDKAALAGNGTYNTLDAKYTENELLNLRTNGVAYSVSTMLWYSNNKAEVVTMQGDLTGHRWEGDQCVLIYSYSETIDIGDKTVDRMTAVTVGYATAYLFAEPTDFADYTSGGYDYSDAYISTNEIDSSRATAVTQWKVIGATKMTPEPATATLSLLALAGLAARRRRH